MSTTANNTNPPTETLTPPPPTTPPPKLLTIPQLKHHIRQIRDHPHPPILFHDLLPLFTNPQTLHTLIHTFLTHPLFTQTSPTHISGLESRGFLLCGLLSTPLNLPIIPIRKHGKIPGSGVRRRRYSSEYGEGGFEVWEEGLRGVGEGGEVRVVVVDDLVATGGSLCAGVGLLREVKGVKVVGVGCVVELDGLRGREKVWKETGLELMSVVRYD